MSYAKMNVLVSHSLRHFGMIYCWSSLRVLKANWLCLQHWHVVDSDGESETRIISLHVARDLTAKLHLAVCFWYSVPVSECHFPRDVAHWRL